MKNRERQILTALAVSWLAVCSHAIAQPAASPATPVPAQTNAAPPPAVADNASSTAGPAKKGLTLNFRGVPVDTVLQYLSESADFTIIREADTQGMGNVDMVSENPVDKAEVVLLLNKVLADNGLAALQDGKTLTIMTAQNAAMNSKTAVVVWDSNAASIPQDAQVVTEVIPLHSLNAPQVIKDLAGLLPADAAVNSNEGGNAIIMTARQADIHHFTQILQALDRSGNGDLEVFILNHADSKSIAEELKEVFTAQEAGAGQGNPLQNLFAGRNAGANGGNAGAENPRRATVRVNAVSDDQNNAVLVSAPEDFMPGISNLIQKLDIQQDDPVEIRVFALHHADPTDVASQMSLLFPDPSTQSGQQNNQRGNRPQFVGGPAASASGTGLSERAKKQATVIAVPDPRTQSVLITASKDTMAQIASVIANLDNSSRGEIHLYIYRPEHADVEDIVGPLSDIFASVANISASSQLNVLAQRANQFMQNGGAPTSQGSFNVGGSSGGK